VCVRRLRGPVGAASSSGREWMRDSRRAELGSGGSSRAPTQRRDWGRGQGTDVWGRREREGTDGGQGTNYAGFE
jgi:hypothetical protein